SKNHLARIESQVVRCGEEVEDLMATEAVEQLHGVQSGSGNFDGVGGKRCGDHGTLQEKGNILNLKDANGVPQKRAPSLKFEIYQSLAAQELTQILPAAACSAAT